MKLGICYMVFDGEELLEFAAASSRKQIDHISVTYQATSYFGNPAGSDLISTLEKLKASKLVDELIYFEPDLSLPPKENELKLRNIGLDASRRAGCTHHISADVDEFYRADQLAYVKEVMKGDYDVAIVPQEIYYKDPTFRVTPNQKMVITLIHPVDNEYDKDIQFPFPIETTRRLSRHEKIRVFSMDEFTVHHMSYVRKDIRKKFKNSDNARFYKIEKFVANFENYQPGGRVCLLPDYLNRKTIQVENTFGIHF